MTDRLDQGPQETPKDLPEAMLHIAAAGAEAVVARLAAGLRSYRRNGVQLTEPAYDVPVAPGGSGLTLAPWPNRIDGGRWLLNGVEQQLDITELTRGHAIHGLLRNHEYTVLAHSAEAVRLAARIYPQHGYPFQLRHEVQYRIADDGSLQVQQTLHNESDAAAPVALGAHPYLRLGDLPAEDLTLTVSAARYLEADDRLIPQGEHPVGAGEDLRAGPRVATLAMDRAYTGLDFDESGWARSTLTAPDGRSVSLRQDKACQFVHIFITTGYPGRTKAVAIEPMSAPANAFNNDIGLQWLAPGASFSIAWGIDSIL